MTGPVDTLLTLQATIDARLAAGDAASSYVASLTAKGLPKVAQKMGEEAVETVIAALSGSDADLAGEAADLLFHLTVLLRQRGLGWNDVVNELARREGVSGIAEKAQRSDHAG